MVHGENTTVVEYHVLDAPAETAVALEVRPLIAFRDHHSLTHENSALNPTFESTEHGVVLHPYADLPPLYLAHSAGTAAAEGVWYRSFQYEEERRRGLDWVEDLFCPALLTFELDAARPVSLIASTLPHAPEQTASLRSGELRRRAAIARSAPVDDDLVRDLTVAADQFLVTRGEGHTIIAGYPWFTDWGRDTMIALPGLTLSTGRYEVARGILDEFARHVDHGLIPNRFPDLHETAEYNTVDATLWYFQAIHEYLRATSDYAFVRDRLYNVLVEIIDSHLRGTRHGIGRSEDGLLSAGEEGFQLTWMDARIGDWVVTPRRGKPVEIQALWYNALRIMQDLAPRFGEEELAARYRSLADAAEVSFRRQFWNPERGCLYDVVDGTVPDASLRPNQVLAVSLPHSMLPLDRARSVIDVVEAHLLTPVGLRTLDRNDPRYRSVYEGDVLSRDSVYHQGIVWPWLMGPFLTGYLRVHGKSAASRKRAGEWLQPFREHLRVGGLGHVSEILDAEPPYHPRGCYAQAWSVAELLRAAVEIAG
jgi:predicted glycogen debranching enzyme